jgi:hypothetical protein
MCVAPRSACTVCCAGVSSVSAAMCPSHNLHAAGADCESKVRTCKQQRARWQEEETRVRYETDSFNLCFYASAIAQGEGTLPTRSTPCSSRLPHRIARMLVESEVCMPSVRLLCKHISEEPP